MNGLIYAARNIDDLNSLTDMAVADRDVAALVDIAEELVTLERRLASLEFRRMFQGEYDSGNAIMEIQAGAGGTEAQEWAEMLMKMYLRWGTKRGFATSVDNIQPGGVAGIKSADVRFDGDHAYGWLRTESGVHRLVRVSPFDSTDRRQSSFAAVDVSPMVRDDLVIVVNPSDVREDTYRASGPGGQHVNVTDSAVRLTHIPTGTVASCQSERSQHQNRKLARERLKAKLYKMELQQRRNDQQAADDSKADIDRGNQIRSYVLDQSRVKDLRCGLERHDPDNVLGGDLDAFMEANLKSMTHK